MDPSRGAVAPDLLLNSTARQVRLAAARNYMAKNDGADHIVNALRNYFAPGRADSTNRLVARFLQFRQPGQTMGGYSVEFDLLRHKAESAMQMGAGFPDAFVFALCAKNAALPRPEKPPALASTQKSLAFSDVATTICRLFGSCGGAARQDILVAKDVDEALGSDKDQEARATDSNTKKRA